MFEGKTDLLEACRERQMRISEQPSNLLECRIKAAGNLDGLVVRVDLNCISGMPSDSQGVISFHGNLAEILSVLNRVWPAPPDRRDVLSPGRQSWPDEARKSR